MYAFASVLNYILGTLTVIAGILSILLVAALAVPRLRSNVFFRSLKEKALWTGFIVSLVATVGSLLYSDVIGYDPCKLCWFQRIFMYPQVLIFLVALVKKDASVRLYSLVLSVVGGLIAAFHYVGQLGLNPLKLDCLAVGYSASCAKNFVLTFGYVTIPMMALSAFALVALTMALSLRKDGAAEIVS